MLSGASVSSLDEVASNVDTENLRAAQINLHEPSLDDVFLAKTGRSLEGAGEEEEEPQAGLAMEPARS